LSKSAPREGSTSRSDPARDTLDVLETQLGTNLQSGLSPQEAEKRLSDREEVSLFAPPNPKFRDCFKTVLAEPVMWLFLAVCVVAMFFERPALGMFSALLMLLHGTVRVFLKYRTLKFEARMGAYDVPLTRVIRNRRLLRVRGDRIVPGDVILLRRGDKIPCDARLITARGLTVSEDTLQSDESLRKTLSLDKDAAVIPETVPNDHSPENMVYAGSVVLGGRCKALVTAVGSHTHLGGLLGGSAVTLNHAVPSYLEKIKKRLSICNLILAVAVIPLTALGILTQGGRYGFLDIFLSALALSVLTLTEHTVIMGLYQSACARQWAADDADVQNSAEIRTAEDAERLLRMDHLILLGSSTLHDGYPHPRYIFTEGDFFTMEHSHREAPAVAFSEKLYLFAMGQAERLKNGTYGYFPELESVVSQVCEFTEPDTEALLLRLEQMTSDEDGVTVRFHQMRPMTLYLTDDPEDLDYCHTYRGEEGVMSLDDATVEEWQALVKDTYAQGYRVQILISECEGTRCIEGLLAMSADGCRKTKGCLAEMQDAGICVTAFLRRATPEDERVLSAVGLMDRAPALDLTGWADDVDLHAAIDSGIQSFFGYKTQDVLDYIHEIHRRGGCVGIVSSERQDLAVLEAADVAITCAPATLRDVLVKEEPWVTGAEGAVADGEPDSPCASDSVRQAAGVIIRRCDVHGGGVCGVRRARLASGQLLRGLQLSIRFVILSTVLRILTLMLPLVSGVTCVSAPALLLSGLLTDALALLCYTRCDLSETLYRNPTGPWVEELSAPHKRYPAELIITAATSLIPFAVALITRILSGSAHGDMAYFCALSLLLTQLVIFATGHRPRRHRRGFFVLVLMFCVYIGFLAVALASGLHVLWCLLLPLIQPAVWLLSYVVCRWLKKISYVA